MSRMIEESEMSLQTLYTHILDSGLDQAEFILEDERIRLYSENGLSYSITLVERKKFVRLSTSLPLRKDSPEEQKHAFANYLNDEVFMPSFYIGDGGDLRIQYSMPYSYGVIAGQLMSIVHRFGSMLEFVVDQKDGNRLIDFSKDDAPIQPPQGCLLN